MWKQTIKRLFKKSNVRIGSDIIIHDESTYKNIITKGSLGLGESYMKKKWDSLHLDVLIAKLIKAGTHKNKFIGALPKFSLWAKSIIFNLQDRKNAPLLLETHYEDNDMQTTGWSL